MLDTITRVISRAMHPGQCPYIGRCGPDSKNPLGWFNSKAEQQGAKEFCYTQRHRTCPAYQQEVKTNQTRREIWPVPSDF